MTVYPRQFPVTDEDQSDAVAPYIKVADWNALVAGALFFDYLDIPESASGISIADRSRIRMYAGRLQASEDGRAYRSMLHPEVNVLDFDADPTGVADSSQAFRDAINSFSASGSSNAGTIIVPEGIYRIASNVSVKKAVWIRGVGTAVVGRGCYIKCDPGVTGFTFERYNTPTGTTDAGSSDGAMISNLSFYNASSHKCAIWAQSTSYAVGAVKKVGPAPGQGIVLLGENQYSHYRCTTAGISSGSGTGPRSLGNDQILNYDGQLVNFTVGAYVYGQTSGALGIVIHDTDDGTTGQLRLTGVSGTFVNNENIRDDPSAGSVLAVVNGSMSAATDDELDGTVRWAYIGPGAAIKIRANAVCVRDVAIDAMSGNGILIWANDPECPAAFANANGWQLRNVNITTCDGHGLFVNGSDANGGLYVGGQIGSCGGPSSDESFTGPGFNIYDSSFLGNTYVAVQFYTVGGQGSIYSDSVGGGSVWDGCYQEGTGGGYSIMSSGNIVIGGGLAQSNFKANGSPTWAASSAVVIAPGNTGGNVGSRIRGFNEVGWRANVYLSVGIKRINGSRLYVVTTAGVTAASGGPTGTGVGIVDNTCVWSYSSEVNVSDGYAVLGSLDPLIKAVLTYQIPDDVGVGLPVQQIYQSYGGISKAVMSEYGTSGPNSAQTEGNGIGLATAQNQTTLTEWPMHIPAGKALFDQLWIGGCRVWFGTTLPTYGSFNPGDRMFYKGASLVAGGAEGKVCVTGGTIHANPGVRTATATGITSIVFSGSAMSTLTDQQDFKVGDKLLINGVTSTVQSLSADGLSAVMGLAIPAGAGLAVATVAPVFQEFGRVAGGAGDSTAAPGNATLNTQKGRSAFAAGASTCVITNSKVVAGSIIGTQLTTNDGTLTSILRCIPTGGSFTVTGNANATGTTNFTWWIHE